MFAACAVALKGLYNEAIADFTKAIELQPDFAEAYSGRGAGACPGKGLRDEAIADYTKTIALSNPTVVGLRNQGLALFREVDCSRSTTATSPITPRRSHPQARLRFSLQQSRALVYANKGLYDDAIADLSKAIALKPDYTEAYGNRGMPYAGKGLRDEAIAGLHRGNPDSGPDYAQAYEYRGQVYGNNGLYDEAIADFTKAIALKLDYTEAYNDRGLAYGQARACGRRPQRLHQRRSHLAPISPARILVAASVLRTNRPPRCRSIAEIFSGLIALEPGLRHGLQQSRLGVPSAG